MEFLIADETVTQIETPLQRRHLAVIFIDKRLLSDIVQKSVAFKTIGLSSVQ
jgi:hypothetical protein